MATQERIDMRSDTITRPSREMRLAMADAEVGDDVLGEDPTAARLEARAAQLLGKPAALFVPTGVMANQIAIHAQTRPRDEVLCAANSHVFYYESGAPAVLSGVTLRPVEAPTGIFSAVEAAKHLRDPTNVHFPRTALFEVENTSNMGGGRIWPLETLAGVSELAHSRGASVHMDGARLCNAAVASGIAEAEFARWADTVSLCFSKGLGAPIGSAIAGSKEFVAEARRARKAFGGGMRQVGIVAAAALFALEHNRDRLAEDHRNARLLADALAHTPGIAIDVQAVQTNIVCFGLAIPQEDMRKSKTRQLVAALASNGVLVNAIEEGNRIRAVTSLEVDAAMIHRAISTIQSELLRL